ncbi:hypothetical protein CEXT_526891, partial [Caerostris extrusa]
IGVKHVRNIRNGGILIETESEEDLDKLIQEFKAQDVLDRDFTIQKPTLRKPHIICFDVSQDTTEQMLLENLNLQFDDPQDPTDKFQIKHHFASKKEASTG